MMRLRQVGPITCPACNKRSELVECDCGDCLGCPPGSRGDKCSKCNQPIMNEGDIMAEMMYTYVSPDGEVYWSDWHETMEDAYREAVEMYGNGVLIRHVWYKEWICGFYQPGQKCGYDKYGNHITADEVANV